MLCNRCQKRDAKILYTEIINGVKKEQHLCQECATNYTSFQMEKPLLNNDFSLNDLLSTLLESYLSNEKKGQNVKKSEIICEHCHTSFEEFLKVGRFGCSRCYSSYQKELGRTLRGIQGSDTHIGKRPHGYISETDRIVRDIPEADRLSLKLQDAIEKEEFEEAAKLRDLIRNLKEGESSNA